MKNNALYGLACKLFVFCTFAFSPIDTHTLTIHIKGLSPNHGQVVVTLFNSEDTFMKVPLLSKTEAVKSQSSVTLSIDQLNSGIYAISVFYDEDKDGELKTGFFGIPKELVGFSNNAKGSFGPPSFEKAAFQLSDSKSISITLGKAKD
ncbi:DUF2141 domain-containing protein [Muriicola sp. Z0-33]|uniref:DUF2141 domain-containing protein n=1 Tax=Muriicola sp. Z0-33 TaxID=2816957 RepID=UPI002238DAF2|nr:DUF2141 domain-containing protein [Muriicola sp. Z0-33]MCW5516694.1 DUF2141 domain-containing protein [Muriicola sp. Z0-33]